MNPAIIMLNTTGSGLPKEDDDCCGCSGFDNDDFDDCNAALEADEVKVHSEITETNQPYQEIEAIINESKLVLRVQKLRPIEDEWDPPCDCISGPSEKTTDPKPIDYKSPYGETSFLTPLKFPELPGSSNRITEKNTNNKKSRKQSPRIIDLEENPNIFLLKIRKRSVTSDKRKENIDLEFRIPRPYKPKPIERKKRKLIRQNPPVEKKENDLIIEEETMPEEIEKKPNKEKNKKSKKGKKKK